MNIARAIRVSRAYRGMNQSELAKAAGLSPSWICLAEAGKREPTFKTIRKIAKALGISVDRLMFRAIDPLELGEDGRIGGDENEYLSKDERCRG